MIVKYDQFVQDLRERKILQDMEFELFDRHGQKHKYRWPYLLSDGSILNSLHAFEIQHLRVCFNVTPPPVCFIILIISD